MISKETQKILDRIENVDPADTKTMDEIDARVWCWNKKLELDSIKCMKVFFLQDGEICLKDVENIPKYTRSIDAQERDLALDGWNWYGSSQYFSDTDRNVNTFVYHKGDVECHSPDLPKEPLARLHVRVQAIDYERNKNEQAT